MIYIDYKTAAECSYKTLQSQMFEIVLHHVRNVYLSMTSQAEYSSDKYKSLSDKCSLSQRSRQAGQNMQKAMLTDNFDHSKCGQHVPE